MKHISYAIFILCVTLLVGCIDNTLKKEEELKAAILSEFDVNSEKIEKEKNEIKNELETKNELIKDVNRVIDFVNDTDTNRMTDQKGKPLKIFENYELHYFDFTGEGHDDVAIVTWEDDNVYLPVIFVTTDTTENTYSLINSDFRANEGDQFFSEGNYIIKDDKINKSYDIAYNIENEFIQMATRYVSYSDEEQVLQPKINIKYIIDHKLEKVDSFNQFNVYSTYKYYDELGEEYLYDDRTKAYFFNESTHEYDIIETHNMDTISLEKLVAQNFIIGTDNSLKTFEMIYNESDLMTAINYYYEKRQQFSKRIRVKYIEDCQNLITSSIGDFCFDINARDEVITDGVISTVTVDVSPIPEKVNSVFSIVKEFYIQDGSIMTNHIIEDGWYTITCIQKDMTEKINLMYYDHEVLINDEHSYQRMVDGYVNTEFVTQEQMLEDIKHITYPTVLIDNLSQLDEFTSKDIWKTSVVIIPKSINFK
ncbi:hypothetical protein J2Z76_001170 [Sedimentibacter acidaminivorans]|uniref:Lipoprotein n=1 Tax=Sedimentibacter acidaminivorans TaxID=913099 RepID=A0ABS4GCB1_9FIRM|nr:hypothetical protein [Sedimentibacter acidaminivorans]MBP1925311.1 hypothetical protein [Sedimentibacter acidaminivorans]